MKNIHNEYDRFLRQVAAGFLKTPYVTTISKSHWCKEFPKKGRQKWNRCVISLLVLFVGVEDNSNGRVCCGGSGSKSFKSGEDACFTGSLKIHNCFSSCSSHIQVLNLAEPGDVNRAHFWSQTLRNWSEVGSAGEGSKTLLHNIQLPGYRYIKHQQI